MGHSKEAFGISAFPVREVKVKESQTLSVLDVLLLEIQVRLLSLVHLKFDLLMGNSKSP